MRKSVFAIALTIIGMGAAHAEQLSPNQALARLQSQQSAPMRVAGKGFDAIPAFTSETGGSKAFYVFNSEAENGGYVIVAADDVAAPMLGYADEGTFDADNIPANMAWWLDQYTQEIKWAIDKGLTTPQAAAPRAARPSIAPLVSARWNQGDPYNLDCPQIGGTRCVTGCVATAMAQIMYYHKWPQGAGKGSVSYEWNGTTLTKNFSSVTFDWNNMTDTYNSNSTTAQKNAVAKLMSACGYSTKMNYGTGESGAQSQLIAWALTEYFDYDKGIQTLSRYAYTKSGWDTVIYNELAAKRPVQYTGRTLAGEGHAFVCDGYNDGYFHINWGWGGASDGYFLTSALDPNDQGIGGAQSGMAFVTDQSIIIGIQKNKGTTTRQQPYIVLYGDLQSSKTEYNIQDNVELSGNPGNGGYTDFSGSIGIKFVKVSDGTTKYISAFNYDGLPPSYYFTDYSEKVNGQTIMNTIGYDSADYIVSLVYRNGSVGSWKDCVASPLGGKLKMTVTSSKILFSAAPDEITLKIGSITALTPFYISNKFMLKATATVQSEYNSTICAHFLTPGTSTVRGLGDDMHVTIEPGGQEFTYTSMLYCNADYSSLPAGNYDLVFADANGKIVSDRMQVSLQSNPGSPTVTLSDLKVVSGNTAPKNNIQFTGKITCTSGYFFDAVTGYIYSTSGGYALGSLPGNTIILNAGETKEFICQGSFEDGVVGTRYAILPYCNNKLYQDVWTYFTLAEAEINDIEPTSVSLTPESVTLEVGESATLTATIAPSDATITDLTWTVSDAAVASVADGTVTALSPGSATVTVTTANGLTATCAVTVTQMPTGVSLSATSMQLEVGETGELTATVEPANSTDTTLTWTVSDESVVKIEGTTVTALAPGSASITVKTVNNLTATCQVTVNLKSQSITWSQTFDGITEGDELTLNATASSGLDVTYSLTEGATLAELSGSKLKVLNAGTIKVKAEQPGDSQYAAAEPVVKEIVAVAGLQSAFADQAWAKAEGGCIVINAEGEVEIFTPAGRLVYAGLDRRVAVEAGVYIVRIGANVVKVVI